LSGRHALVTGGCGFVGRHVIKWLLAHDFQITVVDDLSTGTAPERWPAHLRVTPAQGKRVAFHIGDFRDFVREKPADYDLIVHLAAVVGGRDIIEKDPLMVATDLAIDATLFHWVVKDRAHVPPRIIYFSSSAAYPIAEQTPEHNRPLTEDLIDFDRRLDLPDMTYGWAKLTGEFLARFAVRQYGLSVSVYRPFSGYGEDQDFTYPFTSIVRRVARRERPIVVWGSGNQLRDFIHIDDIIAAVFATCDRFSGAEALNLCSGVGTSFRQLAELTGRVIGHEAEVVNDPAKPEGVFARVGDATRMFQYYRPLISLEEGIRRTYEYQKAAGLL